jgi:hypothetical protein
MRLAVVLLAALVIPACGSSSSGFGPSITSSILPVAQVPENFKVLVNQAGVKLDGSKSHDPVPAAPPLTYLWTQTAGTAVALSSPTTVSPTFTAPASKGTLTFMLTVTGAQGTDSATVTVNVQAFIVSAADQWWVGYGNPVTITAGVSGTVNSPTYQWSGLPSWVNVPSTTSLTLSFTAPQLTDFQNFEDVPGVAVMERTTQGRAQFTITVTDGKTNDVDQALVNFSVGPFATTVANENVAFGNPVFLNGAATVNGNPITAWAWSGTKPNGTALSSTTLPSSDFKTPNQAGLNGATLQRFVYFVPDQLGTYQIQIAQTPGSVVQVVTINSGKYVGVGNLTGSTPDPNKGECAACHAGQLSFVPDYANPWLLTQHAQVFAQMVDPTNPLYAPSQAKGSWKDAFDFVPPGGLTQEQLRSFEFSIDGRTLGWSRITSGSQGGWVEQATTEGFALPGTTWPETIRKSPFTASRSNTQCESCHGPGSEHLGDTAGIRVSYDSLVCGRCHAQKEDLWDVSAHADRTSMAFQDASGSASCNGCHTAQGFITEMMAQKTATPHPVLFAFSNPNRPVIGINDRRTQTCQTCHDPHENTVGMGGTNPDPQLRAFGQVQFRNGAVVDAGRAAVCYMCHQSRTDTRVNSPDMNVRRAPHDSTAAEMISGTNGIEFPGWTYNVSPHGIPGRFVSPSGENRHCLACHNDVQPAPGAVGYGALGGHSFNITQGTGLAIPNANLTTGSAQTVMGTKQFTISAGPGFLKTVFPGDTLTLTGPDAGAYTVASVDTSTQLTVAAAGSFTSASPATWAVTSVQKYNSAACVQCHPTAPNLQDIARGDYDGDHSTDTVQAEIAGLMGALATTINNQLVVLLGNANVANPSTYSFTIASGRVVYALTTNLATGPYFTFPGPQVTSSQNSQISWSVLPTLPANAIVNQQAEWLSLYQAAYNWSFVTNDRSGGIHNTGYAVNLLQSSIKAVSPAAVLGAPFVPFP